MERITANAGNAIRYGYACKSSAIIERIIANASYAIRDVYAGKLWALVERITANACYTVGNNKICYKLTVKI